MIQFITTNAGKFQEVAEKLRDANIRIAHLDRTYPEIQADRLEKVVRYAATVLDDEVPGEYLIDDSGLFIEALKGFPGVYSSYVYRTIGCPGVLRLMEGERYRAATFEAVFLLRQGEHHEVFQGSCRGTISDRERGTGGFGFDPIFIPEGERRTFAEMSREEKNAVSHRGRAVEALVAYLKAGKEA